MRNEPASLASRLRQRAHAAIAADGGWWPFDRFMAFALYEPGLGYYSRSDRMFGAMPSSGSDFVTAPELSPLFGAALAAQVAQALDATGTDEVWEFGAGSGALAGQLLRALGPRVRRYRIVDLSGALRARQQERLRWATLFLRLAAIALVLWAGFRYSRRLQAELAGQMRLRNAVTQANEALESKVRQRTAELETANQQLETLSATDGLTGLANRRSFDSYWAQEWQRAVRQGTPLAVIMLDVDHFKAYNDHYGHQQGDACLRTLGEVLRATVRRAGELAARYGGEEFVVVMPGASAQKAQETAISILSALGAEHLPHASSPVAPVITISLGVAGGTPGAADDRELLIKAADIALFEAKHLGRNRVVMSSPTF